MKNAKILFVGFPSFYIGRFLSWRRRYDIAVQMYVTAQKNHFRTEDSQLKEALATMNQRKWADAKRLLYECYKDTGRTDAAVPLAHCYIEIGETVKAVRLLKKVINDDPTSVSVYYKLATALYQQGNYNEYTQVQKKLAELDPSLGQKVKLLAAYAKTGDESSATELVRIIINDNSVQFSKKIAAIDKAADAYIDSFYYDLAIQLYAFAEEEGYYTASTLNSLAVLYRQTNDQPSALACYEQIGEEFPAHSWWSTYFTGVMHTKNKNYEQATKHFKKHFEGLEKEAITQAKKKFHFLKELDKLSSALDASKKKNHAEATKLFMSIYKGWNGTYRINDSSLKQKGGKHSRFWDLLHVRSFNKKIARHISNKETSYCEYLLLRKIILTGSEDLGLIRKLKTVRAVRGASFARKKLWISAFECFSSSFEINGLFDLHASIKDYRYFILASRETNSQKTAFEAAHEGLEKFPDSLVLKKELAILYSKNRNVYKSKELWLEIYKENEDSLKPVDFTRITSSLLTAQELDLHDEIINKAKEKFGNDNPTILYNEFHSLFSKKINCDTERNLFGFGENLKRYDEKKLIAQAQRIGKTLKDYVLRDEQNHKVRRRSATLALMNTEDLWRSKKTHSEAKQATYNILHTHLAGDLSDELCEKISALIHFERAGKEGAHKEQKHLEDVNANHLDFIDWLILHDVFTYNKMLHLGFIAREKAIDSLLLVAYDGPLVTPYILHRKLHALMERANFNEAQELYKKLDLYFEDRPKNTELKSLLAVQSKKEKLQTRFFESFNDTTENIMKKLIKNRDVAIVGPAPGDSKQGKEIDSFDTIIRFNYRGEDSMPDKDFGGSKIDIAYQNGPNVRAYLQEEIPEYMEDLSLYNVEIILSEPLSDSIETGNARFNGGRVQLLNYAMMAVPTVLFDVLHYSPNKVKVFNSNFYLSNTPYAASYTKHNGEHRLVDADNKKLELFRLHELTGAHDLISQIRFMRNVLHNGKVELDDECSYVVNLEDADYMRKMEDIFSFAA